MRHFARIQFNLASALSLTLFIAAFSFWVRSCDVQDTFHRYAYDGEWHLSISVGVMRLYRSDPGIYTRMAPPSMVRTTYRHETLRPPRPFHEPAYRGQRVTFTRFGFIVWDLKNTPGVPPQWGMNVPLWSLVVLSALLPTYWFLSFRHLKRQAHRRGFEVSAAPTDP